MTRRKTFISASSSRQSHSNACRIGNLLMSASSSAATRPARCRKDRTSAPTCSGHEGHRGAGGGATSDIIKMTVWLQIHQRAPVNTEWLKMFPDEHSRPARHALQMDMENGALVQCDFTAVIG
jgi:hypothetical protein